MGLFSGIYLNLPKLFENSVIFFCPVFIFKFSIEVFWYRSFTVSICGLWMNLQWNLDLVTLNLQPVIWWLFFKDTFQNLLQKIIQFSDIMQRPNRDCTVLYLLRALLWECSGGIVLCCWEVVSCFLCWVR